MFRLLATSPFKQNLAKATGNDEQRKKRLKTFFQKLALNPAHPSLKSHKVNTPDYGIRWSSWVTPDLRIIWDYYEEEQLTIVLLDIGGHSGSHKVY